MPVDAAEKGMERICLNQLADHVVESLEPKVLDVIGLSVRTMDGLTELGNKHKAVRPTQSIQIPTC